MMNMNFLRGMGIGLIVGSAIGMTVTPHKKCGKNVVGRALKSVGEVIESITDAIG